MADIVPRGVGVPIVSVEKLIQMELDADNSLFEDSQKKAVELDGLTSYIVSVFQKNKDAKVTSGIEQEIIDSVRAKNGQYSDEDLAKIAAEGGSNIFMNITATKSRVAKSWISSIFLPTKGKAWSLEPSPSEDILESVKSSIESTINNEFQQSAQASQEQPTANQAQQQIQETNQDKRDIVLAISEEVKKEAKFQLINMERNIEDQLNKGEFNQALATFIDDFCTYPTAFMKGPVICKKPQIYWENGKAKAKDTYYFMNERVDPLDMYPSPDATTIQDGNLCEHMRMSPSTLGNLKGIEGYSTVNIDEILSNELYGNGWLDTGSVEQEKIDEEFRGDITTANENVVHGIHYHGAVPYKLVQEWKPGFKLKEADKEMEEWDLVEVDAIVAGGKAIKCNVNGDPLKRRPYYKASYMNRPGSFWGRSLPSVMAPYQRMCNAAARALANNMALGSGPMMEVSIDRIADGTNLSEIRPRMIIQTVMNPTGGGGQAINFFQPQIIAGELLAVYDKYEQKADDVTGVPAYAYGNDRLGAAPSTVGGLSLLLESTSKIIKDCITNIDLGLIIPRIEYQFYFNLLYNPGDFTGDVEVVARASSTLTSQASEALRRQEFLQITANQFDQQAMGMNGRTEILREMAEDLGLPAGAIPSRLEVKRTQKMIEQQQAQAQQVEMQKEQQKNESSIAATKLQIDGQMQMHQGTLALNAEKLKADTEIGAAKVQLAARDSDIKHQLKGAEIQTSAQTSAEATKAKTDANLREVALKLQGKTGI